MRYLCLFFFMLNCQVKKSDPIKVNSETQSDIKKVNSQKTISEIDKEFLINDENVMEFFLEYDKLNKETSVVFIVRKSNSGIHSSQVGFPGGKPEKQDVDLSQTAIRETHEEIGVNIKTIKIIRPMTEVFIPPSNFVVKPYIGYTLKTPNFTPQISEIDSIFEVSLKSILNFNNQKKSIVKTSYGPTISVPSFVFNGHIIWGATAMILIEIVSLLNLINKK